MMITESEQEKRKLRIIMTSYKLFCADGIYSVTIEDIAKKSHVSTASVYRYFSTKTNLLLATQKILWEEVVDYMISHQGIKLNDSQSGLQQMSILLNAFQSMYEQHSGYVLFACDYKLYLVRQRVQLSDAEHQEMLYPVKQVFSQVIMRGQEDGTITTVKDAETLFFVIWGMLRGYVEQIVLYDKIKIGVNPWKKYFPIVSDSILILLTP